MTGKEQLKLGKKRVKDIEKFFGQAKPTEGGSVVIINQEELKSIVLYLVSERLKDNVKPIIASDDLGSTNLYFKVL